MCVETHDPSWPVRNCAIKMILHWAKCNITIRYLMTNKKQILNRSSKSKYTCTMKRGLNFFSFDIKPLSPPVCTSIRDYFWLVTWRSSMGFYHVNSFISLVNGFSPVQINFLTCLSNVQFQATINYVSVISELWTVSDQNIQHSGVVYWSMHTLNGYY